MSLPGKQSISFNGEIESESFIFIGCAKQKMSYHDLQSYTMHIFLGKIGPLNFSFFIKEFCVESMGVDNKLDMTESVITTCEMHFAQCV